MKKFLFTAAIAMIVIVMGGAAFAGSTTQTFTAQASVVNGCSVTDTSSSTIDFGAYDPTAATATPVLGSISVTCTKNATVGTYITGNRFIAIGGGNLTFTLYEGTTQATPYPSTQATERTQTATSGLTTPVVVDYNAVADTGLNLSAAAQATTTLTLNIDF